MSANKKKEIKAMLTENTCSRGE